MVVARDIVGPVTLFVELGLVDKNNYEDSKALLTTKCLYPFPRSALIVAS